MPNSLTSYLIFDDQTVCFLCCKLVYGLTSPPASLEQFSQSYWDAISQAWSHKHPTKQNNFTFRSWLYFLDNNFYNIWRYTLCPVHLRHTGSSWWMNDCQIHENYSSLSDKNYLDNFVIFQILWKMLQWKLNCISIWDIAFLYTQS